jgi:hypothetical protein
VRVSDYDSGRVWNGSPFRHSSAISRPDTPEFCWKIPYPLMRGRREAGRPMRPIAACAMGSVRAHTRWSGHTGITRHSPRNGLRLISCSPRRPGSFATVALRVFSQVLMPASGHQDHTPSPSASSAFVKGAIRVHRIPPRVDDVAQRPSFGTGWPVI